MANPYVLVDDNYLADFATLRASVDTDTIPPHHGAMSSPTKDEMKSALEVSEARVDARLANFDTSIKTGFAELRTDFARMQTEMAKQNGEFRTDMASLRGEMHKNTSDLIKWAAGLAFLAVGATVGLLNYMNKASAEKSPQQTAAPVVNPVPAQQPPTQPTAPPTK